MPNIASVTFTANRIVPRFPDDARTLAVKLAPNTTFRKGMVLAQMTAASVNEVQTPTLSSGSSSGGTFTLTFQGETTAAIAYNASAATVKAALEALTTIGEGNVTVSGTQIDTGYTVTFVNALAAMDIPIMTITSSLTGSSPVATVTATTAGVSYGRYAEYTNGGSNGLDEPIGILEYDCRTDHFGRVIMGNQLINEIGNGPMEETASMFYKGEFLLSDIYTTINSGDVSEFCRFIKGNLTNTAGDAIISLL